MSNNDYISINHQKLYDLRKQLIACPHCGHERGFVSGDQYYDDIDIVITQYKSGCCKCNARTGNYDTPEESVEAWNRRA